MDDAIGNMVDGVLTTLRDIGTLLLGTVIGLGQQHHPTLGSWLFKCYCLG